MTEAAHLLGEPRWARTWWRCWTWRCWRPGWSYGKAKPLSDIFTLSQGGTWHLKPHDRHWKATNKQTNIDKQQTNKSMSQGGTWLLRPPGGEEQGGAGGVEHDGRQVQYLLFCLFVGFFCACLFVSPFVVVTCIPWISCSFFFNLFFSSGGRWLRICFKWSMWQERERRSPHSYGRWTIFVWNLTIFVFIISTIFGSFLE